ncbi:hypothetical protein HETIRDRAFT_453187 [Heterobasidion irregulare TC 32-1]|uniref:Uncharacterized protein n=1 Tax=Heterobasidion irregulare (strain TC 32-1) TaxID=747525 RepID=W4JZL7_HETIT|nr:uncharacterized protein HETIRDRAFT_453187 [Heterobasidion irregulare TC 32-1]ETW78535.1 hypothetical protein HETIRDRAFT_453187 [Heterobasidion irregulare TC 32-1]
MSHWSDLNYYPAFPDNNASKPIYFETPGLEPAAVLGSRHVLLIWDNDRGGTLVHQVMQLTGIPSRYFYDTSPVAKLRNPATRPLNTYISLGTFTRAQRDAILELAKAVPYDPASYINGCQVWTRDLLQAMIAHGYLAESTFRQIEAVVPLIHRRA